MRAQQHLQRAAQHALGGACARAALRQRGAQRLAGRARVEQQPGVHLRRQRAAACPQPDTLPYQQNTPRKLQRLW